MQSPGFSMVIWSVAAVLGFGWFVSMCFWLQTEASGTYQAATFFGIWAWRVAVLAALLSIREAVTQAAQSQSPPSPSAGERD